ncbi:MAG TPA: methyltransferase domain-containing protein [Terriglobia bacterium]|nr:methyltransferase domain-containing protein [Terriglobia bacterium]
MSKKHQATVQKQFTNTAEAFSKFAVRDSPEVIADKVRFLKPQPEMLFLDVACGPGGLVMAMAPELRYAFGMDLTPEMLRYSRQFQAEKQVPNAAFICAEGEAIPYADAAFDLVSCQYAFHHIPKPDLVLQEMLRVTKPDGRIFVDDTLGPESDEKFELHNRIEVVRDPSHTRSLRLTTFLKMFDNFGLEIVSQSFRRHRRSFNQWMLRAGHPPDDKRYVEARRLIEKSAQGDKAGFSPQIQGDDIEIVHNEGMFLVARRSES